MKQKKRETVDRKEFKEPQGTCSQEKMRKTDDKKKKTCWPQVGRNWQKGGKEERRRKQKTGHRKRRLVP